jgi:F0F1-type ATP synthase membrane subunit b/b'
MDMIYKILTALNIDQTFFHIFFLYILFFFIFSKMTLNPLLKILLRREYETEGLAKEAEAKRLEAESLQKIARKTLLEHSQKEILLTDQIKQSLLLELEAEKKMLHQELATKFNKFEQDSEKEKLKTIEELKLTRKDLNEQLAKKLIQ